MSRKTSYAFLLAALVAAGSTAVSAQTMATNSASFNAGYGRTAGSENSPVNVSLTDAQGNLEVVNGEFKGVASGSAFASASAGAMDSYSGAGGTASAIGNNLSVVVEGNNNTVIVTSTQTNTGAVTATTTTNGKP